MSGITPLSPLERQFINRFQGGFPIVERPFKVVATKLGTTEFTLISLIQKLLRDQKLSRFGPLYNASKLGGRSLLAALEVPEVRFEQVTKQVNSLVAVAHNYRREHRLNMWFVLSSESEQVLHQSIRQIEQQTGLQVYLFPKEKEFYLGLWLQLNDDGSVDTRAIDQQFPLVAAELDEVDRRLISLTEQGLPLDPEPWKVIADQCGIQEERVRQRLSCMLCSGAIRRIGAIPDHYRLGMRSNAMTVWDVDDRVVDKIGTLFASQTFVSHCYTRPRYPGCWPYNLFAMVHSSDPAQVEARIESLRCLSDGACQRYDVLYSSRVLKKTGLRLAT